MFSRILLSAGVLAFGLAGAAQAATMTLSGVIRDFSASHPDFESTIGGLQMGQIASTLGVDGKPVFVGPAKSGFTTAANFDQWYNDVPGVNEPTPFDLILNNSVSAPETFTYASSSFFPIDGQLGGNEGLSHNYHFTLQLGGMFAYDDGDIFNFTGDDDLWVFFDKKLGIDLGGVHGATSKTVTSVDLDALGLMQGTEYALDIFFAERHTSESNFNITTTLSVTPMPAVPLPAGLPLLGAGMLVMAGIRRLKRRTA